MSSNCNDKNPLQRDGLSQQERLLKALDPTFPKVDELGVEEWLRFAYEYAKEINFFDENNISVPNGDWSEFFNKENHESLLNPEKGTIEPHIALFISFLQLLKTAQNDLNDIPRRHLDFYYKQVLQLKAKPFQPDSVHVLFELARKAQEQNIPKGSLLDAGKDKNGKKLFFETTEDIVVNTAKIASIQSKFLRSFKLRKDFLHVAYTANSSDGLGGQFETDDVSWSGFGTDSNPLATVGFAFASPVLLLNEGQRVVYVEISFKAQIRQIDFDAMQAGLQVNSTVETSPFQCYLSGEEEWLGPFPIAHNEPITTFPNLVDNEDGSYTMTLVVNLDPSIPKVVGYNKSVLGSSFTSTDPILQLRLNNSSDFDLSGVFYRNFSRVLMEEVKIWVDVRDVSELSLENDQGRLDASKPFFPFGTTPTSRSNFYIGNREAFGKYLEEASVTVQWHDIPNTDLKVHYAAYDTSYIDNPASYDFDGTPRLSPVVDSNAHFKVKAVVPKQDSPDDDQAMFLPNASDPQEIILVGDASSSSSSSGGSGSSGSSSSGGGFGAFGNRQFIPVNSERRFFFGNQINQLNLGLINYVPILGLNVQSQPTSGTLNFSNSTKEGFATLTLTENFLHKAYPSLFAIAMATYAKDADPNAAPNIILPNEPYTPSIETLTLKYTSKKYTTDLTSASASNYVNQQVKFFHLDAFGEIEEHKFLRENTPFLSTEDKNIYLVPREKSRASMFIGLSDVKPGQVVNLLFQVLEDSASPDINLANTEIRWSVLVNNYWMPLPKSAILNNDTNDLLSSGIVSLAIPKEATSDNTLMQSGLIWLRSSIHVAKQLEGTIPFQSAYVNDAIPESVCRFINVHTQAVKARFANNQNDLSHLATSLSEGTISKMVNRPAFVKKLDQPYPSFEGAESEADIDYYRRISERLRHKNRAVQIADYERLILEKFPTLYKVKCLNHTSKKTQTGKIDRDDCQHYDNRDSEMAPGCVTAILIPNLKNQNTAQRLQPKASLDLISKIEQFIQPIKSLFVNFKASNPKYESVQLEFAVAFRQKGNFDFYRQLLMNDIVRYLSPWAYEDFTNIHFGGSLHKNTVINFIEERPYVDFLEDFKMYTIIDQVIDDETVKVKSLDQDIISTSDSRAILVSVNPEIEEEQHIINEAQSTC